MVVTEIALLTKLKIFTVLFFLTEKKFPNFCTLSYLAILENLQICFLTNYKEVNFKVNYYARFSPANFTTPAIQKTLVGRLQSVLGTSTLTFSEISPQQVPIGACHIKIIKLSSYEIKSKTHGSKLSTTIQSW